MSAWTKFATQFFHNKQKKDPDYKFSQALKEASKVYKKTKGGSSKNCGGAVDPNKTNKDGKPCTDADADDPLCQETPAPETEVEVTAAEATKAVDPNPNAISVATANIDKQQIDAAAIGKPNIPPTNSIVTTDGNLNNGGSTGGKKSKRKSKKAGKKSQKKSKKAGSKKSKK